MRRRICVPRDPHRAVSDPIRAEARRISAATYQFSSSPTVVTTFRRAGMATYRQTLRRFNQPDLQAACRD